MQCHASQKGTAKGNMAARQKLVLIAAIQKSHNQTNAQSAPDNALYPIHKKESSRKQTVDICEIKGL